MSLTETTHTSWFSRLKNGVIGIFIGFLLIIGMIWLLTWNEGRSIRTYRALAEGAGIVVDVANTPVDPANNGKLVHISGPVVPQGTPQDSLLGVSAEGATALSRKVEMFQWVEESSSETRKTLGGGEETVTTYSYRKEWRTGVVDSSKFRQSNEHFNPQLPLDSETFPVASASIGDFTLQGSDVAGLGADRSIPATGDVVASVEAALPSDRPVSTDGNAIFSSFNRQNPDVGDLRITFTREDLAEASFVGQQDGTAITPYRTSNAQTIFLRSGGLESAAAMFETAQSENTMITWLIRVGGLVGMFIGFRLMLSLLGIIADIIPFVGSIVSFGTGLIAFVLTLILGPVVIAVAWFAYRPLLSIGILAVAALVAAAAIYLRRGKAAQPAAA